ncbi:MAG: hypothetical protein HOE90_13065 [Bacteriovoracaceae bacterium]|nr:hypothetical protein [Bacteriovoracaceae bacterium]
MKANPLVNMLLIQDKSISNLFSEFSKISLYFIPVCFVSALILEFYGKLNFGEVIKRLVIALVVTSAFYSFHKMAVETSFNVAYKTFKKVSPQNLFIRKWTQTKLKTNPHKSWGWLEKISIPNLNDLVATCFFLLSKIFLWILKLIFSTVYHLTYLFSGLSACLYLFQETQKSLSGILRSSLWCIIFPFVVISILSLVGNSISSRAIQSKLLFTDIEVIIWLLGISFILLLSPAITLAIIGKEGIGGASPALSNFLVGKGLATIRTIPSIQKVIVSTPQTISRNFSKVSKYLPRTRRNK